MLPQFVAGANSSHRHQNQHCKGCRHTHWTWRYDDQVLLLGDSWLKDDVKKAGMKISKFNAGFYDAFQFLALWLTCLLNKTMSPSTMCLSTISPWRSSWAIFARLPYFKNFFICEKDKKTFPKQTHLIGQFENNTLISVHSTKFAPGWLSAPLMISFLKKSILAGFTRSG